MGISQEARELRVTTELGDDVLVLEAFSGSEFISSPFLFHVDMLSEDSDIDTEALLRTPISLVVTLDDGTERDIHGMISSVVQLGQDQGLTSYQAEMVPWLWFLGLNRDSRIFQQMSVLDIVEQVFSDRGQTDFEIRCSASYPVVEYCVQYRESDMDFVQRLLEREGIFYFFKHDDGKHTMVIADDLAAFETAPLQPVLIYRGEGSAVEGGLSTFRREHSVHVGKVTLRDYDPLQPNMDLTAELSGNEEQEYYDYPGSYAKLFCNDPGDLIDQAKRYALLRLELEEGRRHLSLGEGTHRGVMVGYRFDLEDHYREDVNREYVVTSLSQSAHAGGYRAGAESGPEYHCSFSVIDAKQVFRPELRTPRPVVDGTQTAVVVGPAGEEVWTDKHGRVKCQFHWDREGQNDENSSCWIRVATPWGGKGYGFVSIPRIGNEVVIDFLEGDPDQPLIVGSVYNADHTVPNSLPGSGIQMGMKSRSSKGGGGYNEISMTDTKGTEQITIHGQFDMNTTVEHNETLSVGSDRTASVGANEAISIGNDQTVDVGSNRTETVGVDETITIGSNREVSVGSSEKLTVVMKRDVKVGINDSTMVGAAQSVTVGGKRSVSVGLKQSVSVKGASEESVGKDKAVQVGKSRQVSIGEDDSLDVGKKLIINAGDEILIKVGKASISMKKDGTIVIEGKDVTLKGSGGMNVKFSKEIVMKGKKILQN